MQKFNFNASGTLEVPDNAIPHYDVAGKLYALEFDNKMYFLQVCFVVEYGTVSQSNVLDYETIFDYDILLEHSIKNVLYDNAEFTKNDD